MKCKKLKTLKKERRLKNVLNQVQPNNKRKLLFLIKNVLVNEVDLEESGVTVVLLKPWSMTR